MADITMCKGTKCLLKETCYRYTANKDMMQSFFVDIPYKDDKCEYYWNITKRKKLFPNSKPLNKEELEKLKKKARKYGVTKGYFKS